MARPPKREKRDKQQNLKLTAREHEWVLLRAKEAGMRPADFRRAKVLADRPRRSEPEAAQPHLAPLLMAQVSRIGNNLNQIARRLHEFDSAALVGIQPVLDEVRAFIRKASGDGA